MITVIEKATSRLHSEIVLEKAAQIIRDGGLVAFPTETVYGLGADALDRNAAKKIYEAKGRPADNPLIIHICSYDMLFQVADHVSEIAKKLAEKFWPGPVSLILQKHKDVPYETTGGLDTVAVRFPSNRIAQELIRKSGVPICAPSANSSGRPSPTRASHVAFDLSGKIDMIIDGGPCEIGLESTIIDCTSKLPVVLRPGAVTEEEIADAIKSVVEQKFEAAEDEKPLAPGMKYKHYSPIADITIIKGSPDAVAAKINELCQQYENEGKKVGVLATDETRLLYNEGHVISVGSRKNMDTVGKNLFKVLRKFDFYEIDIILSEGFEMDGIGEAVMNRLLKAAAYNVVEV